MNRCIPPVRMALIQNMQQSPLPRGGKTLSAEIVFAQPFPIYPKYRFPSTNFTKSFMTHCLAGHIISLDSHITGDFLIYVFSCRVCAEMLMTVPLPIPRVGNPEQ